MLRAWDVCNGDSTTIRLEGFEPVGLPERAFSANCAQVVGSSGDGSLGLWDIQSGSRVGPPVRGHKIFSVTFSPDGKLVASGSFDEEILLFDANSLGLMERLRMGHKNTVRALDFSPDSMQLVSGGDDNLIRVWDVSTGNQIGAAFKGHTDWIRCVVYSPDGNRIASGSDDCTVRVWDAETGSLCFAPLMHRTADSIEFVISVTYSLDGEFIASGGDKGNIHVWNSQTGNHLNHLQVGHHRIQEIVFSPDGKKLASCTMREIHVWQLDEKGIGLKDPTGLLALDNISSGNVRLAKSLVLPGN